MRLHSRMAVSLGVICIVLSATFAISQDAKITVTKKVLRKAEAVEKPKDAIVSPFVIQFAPAPAQGVAVKKAGVAGAFVLPEVRIIENRAMQLQIQAARPAMAANLEPLIEQFQVKFRPLVRSEVHLIRKVCDTTSEQDQKLGEQAELALKKLATKFATFQQQINMGQWHVGIDDTAPRRALSEIFATDLAPILSKDQIQRYRQELDKRSADFQSVVVSTLSEKLERELVLTAEQRDKISDSLLAHWQNHWCPTIEYIQYLDQFLPALPNECVAPFLDDQQKVVWSELPKGTRVHLGIGMRPLQGLDETSFKDEPLGNTPANAKPLANQGTKATDRPKAESVPDRKEP